MSVPPASNQSELTTLTATTPINIEQLEVELRQHPDRSFVTELISGLRTGFDMKVFNPPISTRECKNLQSALTRPDEVDRLISDELQKGFLAGPFDIPPFPVYRVSPVGVAEGKYSKKLRMILDLSSPHEESVSSINDLINKSECSLSYVKIDDAIHSILEQGRGAQLCKTDIADAFKLLPILPSQWHLFCLKWRNKYYHFVRLPFGCRSSPKIFDKLSLAICWIAQHNYNIQIIFHLLDDFLTVDAPHNVGERTMALLCMIFHRLGIPLSAKKTVGPTTCLEYLGVILDSIGMEARLPREKIIRISTVIESFQSRRSCTKRELLQLLGHFNFASRVITPGRSFVSYLIRLSTTAKQLHHFVHLTAECREDLKMWALFLKNWNGVSFFKESMCTTSNELELYTDASSTIGHGGYFKNQWFCEKWHPEMPKLQESLSMAFLELYPIVVAAVLWGKFWEGKRIVFLCDNEATVAIINKGRSRELCIMRLMRRLTWTAAINNFSFSSRHIPGITNNIADALSRLQITKFRQAAPNAEPHPVQCPLPSDVMWH